MTSTSPQRIGTDPDALPFAERIRLGIERAITVDVAVKHPALAKNGRPPAKGAFYRWLSRGTRGVRIDSCLSGGVRVTSNEAIDRFHIALNEGDAQRGQRVSAGATPRQMSAAARRSHQSALRELERAGLTGSRKGAA
jgi:hypothetical protein